MVEILLDGFQSELTDDAKMKSRTHFGISLWKLRASACRIIPVMKKIVRFHTMYIKHNICKLLEVQDVNPEVHLRRVIETADQHWSYVEFVVKNNQCENFPLASKLRHIQKIKSVSPLI